jgi:hypothetical protein
MAASLLSSVVRPIAVVARAVAVLALVAAGCGDDAPSAAENERLAERAVLTEADLPPGWGAVSAPPGGGDLIETCFAGTGSAAVAELQAARVATAESPAFGKAETGQPVTVTSEGWVFDDDKAAGRAVNAYREVDLERCVRRVLDEQQEARLEIAQVVEQPVDPPPVGDEAVARRLRLTGVAGESAFEVVAVVYGVRHGRTFTSLTVTQGLGEPDLDVVRAMLGAISDRLSGSG